MNYQWKYSSRRGGMSMMELLFAVSILLILAALLFPAFRSIRERSRMLTCSSNLRQIGIGLISYSTDWDGYYPPADPQNTNITTWGYSIWSYCGMKKDSFQNNVFDDKTYSTDTGEPIEPANIFQCPTTRLERDNVYIPTYVPASHAKYPGHKLIYSYGMNCRPTQLQMFDIYPAFKTGDDLNYSMNRNRISNWSKTSFIMEFDSNSLAAREYFQQWGLAPHREGSNILFHDGHVEWRNIKDIPGYPDGLGSAADDIFWAGR